MTCTQCRHEFCWLCNGPWAAHGERTGGFYACNRFELAKKAGEYDDESRRRDNAKVRRTGNGSGGCQPATRYHAHPSRQAMRLPARPPPAAGIGSSTRHPTPPPPSIIPPHPTRPHQPFPTSPAPLPPRAQASLERYMHYFERWDAHNKARDKARQEAARTAGEALEALSDLTRTPTSQLKFIMDAWAQVIECRRMLKW